jgi:hypothetical protein
MKICSRCKNMIEDDTVTCPFCFNDIEDNPIISIPESENDRNLSGWWVGFFFGWIGVVILLIINRGKPVNQRYPVGFATFWAVLAIIINFALLGSLFM